MTRLVEHVGDPVLARRAAGVELVAEGVAMVPIGEQHHVRRVRRGRDVLQVVRRVGPPTTHGDGLHRMSGVVDDDAVVRVHGVADDRIPARSLLAHVIQQRVGAAVVCMRVDAQLARRDAECRDAVASRAAELGEIESPRALARAERATRDDLAWTIHGASALIAHHERPARRRRRSSARQADSLPD